MTMAPPLGNENRILTAVQLGWLVVETFGLLRRYGRHGRLTADGKTDPNRRFNFPERDLTRYEQTLVALQRLKVTAVRLVPEPYDRPAAHSGCPACCAARAIPADPS
jgi:hypothetical protein